MKKSLQVSEEHYPFSVAEGEQPAYSFRTRFEIEYTVVFKPSPSVFELEAPCSSLVYEIEVWATFAGPQSYVRDDLIAPTVVTIFLHFYNQQGPDTCFLLFDSSGAKERVRRQKLIDWFYEYNRGAFVKIDRMMPFGDSMKPVSIFFSTGNAFSIELSQAFSDCLHLQ